MIDWGIFTIEAFFKWLSFIWFLWAGRPPLPFWASDYWGILYLSQVYWWSIIPGLGSKASDYRGKIWSFSCRVGRKVPLGSNETTYLLIWPRIPLYFPVSLWYRNGPNEWKLGINPTPVGFRPGGAANQWGASTLSDKLIGYFNHGLGFQLKTWICINWMYAWVIITMDSRLDKLRIERNCLK